MWQPVTDKDQPDAKSGWKRMRPPEGIKKVDQFVVGSRREKKQKQEQDHQQVGLSNTPSELLTLKMLLSPLANIPKAKCPQPKPITLKKAIITWPVILVPSTALNTSPALNINSATNTIRLL